MKIDKLVSTLSSEIAVLTPAEAVGYDVPFADGFSLDALKEVDDDPFFVTVAIKPGRGDQGNGMLYDEDILKSLETQFNSKRPPGYKGHQDPEKVSWEYREAVTAWVGAQLVADSDGKSQLLVKGYVPRTAEDLRTQLRLAQSGADVVNSVSIFGTRSTENGRVKDFDLWSLDWTPKGRAGMETELVGVSGEQAKEDEVTREEVIASLKLIEVPEHISNALRAEGRTEVASDIAIAGEMRVIFELDEEADSEAVITAVRGLVNADKSATLTRRVEEALGEADITAEMAKEAVRDVVLHSVTDAATKEEIAGEIAAALDRPYIKTLVDSAAAPIVNGGRFKTDDARKGTVWE
jgi:hypothetical protein